MRTVMSGEGPASTQHPVASASSLQPQGWHHFTWTNMQARTRLLVALMGVGLPGGHLWEAEENLPRELLRGRGRTGQMS